ncbi:MAG: TonB-dependent receptor, partial [Casimicrobiaceae bacterium]
KGALAGWRYDTALSYGLNSIDDRYTAGYVYASAIFPVLNSGRVNPFGYNTPEVVSQLAATQVDETVREGRSTQLMLDFRAWNAIYDLPGGPLSVAIGAEARQWRQTQTSSAAVASRNIVDAYPFQSMNASRDIWAIFAEANAPLARDFEANLALRFDHYSDMGSSTSPKLSMRWQPMPALLFRASAGSGFRAPSLEALYAPQVTFATPPMNDPARCPTTNLPTDCGFAFPFKAGGNPALESETSSQWGVGAVWSPTPSLTLGADYFDVIVHNFINGVSPLIVLPNCPNGVEGPSCRFVVRHPREDAYPDIPGPVDYLNVAFFNSGTIRTTGVDLNAQFRLPRYDWGQLKLSMQGTYIFKYQQQQLDGSYVNQVNRELSVGLGGAIPYWHHYLTIDWSSGSWTATLTENFLRGTYDAYPNPGESQLRKVGNYDIWNVAASYGGFKGWQLSAGIKNLFNRDPPFSNQTFTGEGPVGYDPTYANPIGRVFWASLTYSFK